MKRKFLSSLMLGALIVASANLTSCKDYDDEIQDLQTQINALTPAINQVKSDLQAEIANLKSQLEAKDAEIKTIAENAKKAAEENAGKLADEIARATAAEAALEAKLGTAQEALDALQKLADGKVDKTDFNDEVTKIYAAIAAVDGKLADHMQKAVEQFGALQQGINDEKALREAAVKDLQQQLDALQTWKDKIAAIEKDYVTNQALKDAIAALKVDDKIAALKTEINGVIDGLKEDLKKVNERIDKLGIDAVVAELKGLVENEAKLREDGDAAVLEAAKTAQKAAEDAQKAAEDAQGAADAAASAVTAEEAARKAAISAEESARKAAISAEEAARKAKDGELEQAIKDAKAALEESIRSLQSTLTTEVARLDKRIDDVETSLQAVSDKLDKVEAFVNALNVLVKGELRSLVFKPDFYYYGIEATRLLSLEYYHFVDDAKTGTPIPAANADLAEKKGTTIDHKNSKEANVDFAAQDVARTIHERYDSLKAFKVLNLVAQYHMNPSNVSKESILDVSVIDDDKPFETDFDTRSSQAVVSVNKALETPYWVENGMLNVNLKVRDQEKIKSVYWNDSVTVFAIKATVRSGEKGDTTITSDYAALKYQQIKDVRLAHAIVNTKTPESITMTGLLNTHCGTCDLVAKYNKKEIDMNHSHLFATVDEAKYFVDNTPRVKDDILGEGQDTVDWNATLDLSKLVEVHYTTVDGAHEKMSAENLAKYGLEYKFELTKFIIGSNTTSESAQAAINPEDGITLRPQMPEKITGKAQAYGAEQSRTTIDRVPLVRVSLIEKTTGHILDYGYIPVRISETGVPPVETPGVSVTYTSTDKWSYTQYDDCFGAGSTAYGRKTTWIETQYDLMKHDALPESFSREDFEKNYLDQDGNAGPLYQDPALAEGSTLTANPDEAQQYILVKGKWTAVKNVSEKIGTITYLPDEDLNGVRTSVFEWKVNADEAIELFKKNKEVQVACLLKSQNYAYPDIFVIFKSDPNNIAFLKATVTGEVDFDAHKISNYWFTLNSNAIQGDGGIREIHAQTLVPEDFFEETADPFDTQLADVFVGNFKNDAVKPNMWIDITTMVDGKKVNNNKAYNKENIQTDFVFESSKQIGTFKGYYKTPNKTTSFKLFASDLDVAAVNAIKTVTDPQLKQGKNLYAYVTSPLDAQLIATIEGEDLETMKVALVHSEDNNGYVEALLNYKAHNELADDVLKAEVSLIAWIDKPKEGAIETADQSDICLIPLKNNSILVRFLRPINVSGTGKDVQDASYAHGDAPQEILLDDLLTYTDWRDTWKPVYNAKTKKWEGLDYKTFYGIQSVKLLGVESGNNVSTNPDVQTTLNQTKIEDGKKVWNGKWVTMSEVSDNVDFVYVEEDGVSKLIYRNLSNVVDEFKVQLPVSVEYLWGTVYQNVVVTVKPSTSQAKKF
ncbi:MAG: hypothetical protein IKQ03_07045 [Prevotella sp.]|nr:hypothetical protein [Prevotella sp.]